MKINKKKWIASELLVVFLLLLETIVEIQGAPVSANTAGSVLCPAPSPGSVCREPEDTCTNHSECKLSSRGNKWIGLCCPHHACKGKKVCKDVRLPTPSTTIRPTTEYITTTEYTTQSSTMSSTTDITASTAPPTNPVTTQTDQFTTTTSSTNKPTSVAKTTSTEKYSSTQESSTTESRTTTTDEKKSTIALPTTEVETTTAERTTEFPTNTRRTTTEMPSSTTPTMTVVTTLITQKPRPSPSTCSQNNAKDILFIIDGTVNYRHHWVTRKKEWKQIKHFVKEVVSELNGDNSRVGVMQYGGRRKPKMEVDLSARTSTADLIYRIGNIRQIGGVKRMTGKSLAIARNKFYKLNSLYKRGSAQDIIVLITRGKPSDRKETLAEVELLKRKMIRVIAIGVAPYPRYLKSCLRNIASFKEDAITTKYSELANKKMDVLERICLPVKLPGSSYYYYYYHYYY
ncbi:Hypothetical predicted protein [Paramuricea clavata]|uniref:Uncharacterized protein n=1 Tax=Paramuricea clavata TaxID=317549 RepID=A0A6S7ISL7_PARCT|nr:Hypothetical predicted protein [Paramuricea clavata]